MKQRRSFRRRRISKRGKTRQDIGSVCDRPINLKLFHFIVPFCSIQLRNAFQGETGPAEKDVIYITLDRPLVFLQPVAVDRAILFWLSYKNAWEYWTEQRLNLNKEVLIATEQVLEKVPLTQITSQLSAQHVGTLFLQLDVRDIGVCVPLSSLSTDPWSNSMLRQVLFGSCLYKYLESNRSYYLNYTLTFRVEIYS